MRFLTPLAAKSLPIRIEDLRTSMGTRFAGHRVNKGDWEAFRAAFAAHYLAHHYLPVMARDLAGRVLTKPDAERTDAYMKALELLKKACAELGPRMPGQPLVSLQLFDRHNTWLFRIIERDWFGDNALAAAGASWPVQDVWYDDHTDMTPEMRRLRPLVERVDEDITARRYLLAPILADDDVFNVFHDEYRRLIESGGAGARAAGPTPTPGPDEADRLLRIHLGSRHALGNWVDAPDPHDIHEHEHDGPGTIRDHPRADRSYDVGKAIDVSVESAETGGTTSAIVAALSRARAALPAAAEEEYRRLALYGPEIAGFQGRP